MNENIVEGKKESMRLLREIVDKIESEELVGVLLTYADGELCISILNLNEVDATNMLMHAASLSHDRLHDGRDMQ